MKKYLVFVSSVVIMTTAAFAQPNPDTLWTHTYGGSSYEEAHSVQQTADGGYIVAGRTESFGAGGSDFYLLKTNSQGDTLWTRTYGGSNYDDARFVKQTANGDYIVAGFTYSFGAGLSDIYLVKTNSLGDTLWMRTYGGNSRDEAISLDTTADGGYIVAGLTQSFGAGGSDFYLVKTNSLGDTLWARIYGGSYEDEAHSVQQTTDGGYILAGWTLSFGAGDWDFYLVKTNPLGDTLWTRTYGGSSYDYAMSVQQTTDGGYILAGTTRSFSASDDFYLVKTNSQGDTLWTRTYGGSSSDKPWSVQQTTDGGYIVAGLTYSFGTGDADFYLVKTNSSGDTLWTRTYGGSNYDRARSVHQTTEGGYIMAGYTSSFGTGAGDLYLLKTGPELAADKPPVFSPTSFNLSCFPNPFNPVTTIVYDLPRAGQISLRVFDLLGRVVAVLKDGFVEAGTHHVAFDGSALASGIYFARLDAGGFSQTKKLMLLK